MVPAGDSSTTEEPVASSADYCIRYMHLARATSDKQNGPAGPFSSLNEFRRDHLGEDRTTPNQRDKDWREPIKQTLNKVDTDLLNRGRDVGDAIRHAPDEDELRRVWPDGVLAPQELEPDPVRFRDGRRQT